MKITTNIQDSNLESKVDRMMLSQLARDISLSKSPKNETYYINIQNDVLDGLNK